VADVDVAIAPGQVTGIIGPNGAGKSTLMNVISGFVTPDAGRITVNDNDVSGLPPHKMCLHGVARTFQNLQMFTDMTVLDVVITGGERHFGTPIWASLLMLPAARREEKRLAHQAKELLTRLEVDSSYWTRRAGELPYGVQRRVEIARALATGPQYLLLDEPAAGLNNEETKSLGITLQGLIADDLGIALIEHDIDLVMNVCTSIYVMDAGRVIAAGTPAEVRSDPAVVKAYLGDESDDE